MKCEENINDLMYTEKIPTRVPGLDDLLFGGINLFKSKNNLIIIKGDDSIDKTILGIQIGYGIAQSLSLQNDFDSNKEVNLISNYHNTSYLNDLLLDILIARCIQKMTEIKVSTKINYTDSHIYNTFFCKERYFSATNKLYLTSSPSLNPTNIDDLICEEALFYNNRTNALHFRSKPFSTDSTTMLYKRKYDAINEYFKDTEEENNSFRDRIKAIKNNLQIPIINAIVHDTSDNDDYPNPNGKIEDVYIYDIIRESEDFDWGKFINNKIKKHHVSILVISKKEKIPNDLANMIIELSNKEVDNYYIYNLSIKRSTSQQTCLGKHQYKVRDYGIEVFPNIYTYFSKRRYMQRAIVYTHSDVVTPTFQQHLDGFTENTPLSENGYDYYIENKDSFSIQNVKELIEPKESYYCSVDILERIFMARRTSYNKNPYNKEIISNYRGGVTAVIGNPNTYKRFITFGSIFSSSINKEHTLILLLNKDDATIRRRLSCPASANKCKCNVDNCKKCYSHIHFMNILMGNITPAEFLFYLRKQIEITYQSVRIKRIIIDDIQILDYCFPLLNESSLFISSLIALCREYDIDLFLLCDKSAKSANQLLAIADNVVCTQRDPAGALMLFIEHYAGYDKKPSKVYCGKVKKPQKLFECYETVDSENMTIKQYGINESRIEDFNISNMDDFWVYTDIKNHKKHK